MRGVRRSAGPAAGLAAAALVAVALAGCGGGGRAPAAPATARTAPVPAPAPATTVPTAVTVRAIGRLPAPVQLPAVTALADGTVRSVAGLSAADTSTDAIVAVGPGGRARRIGAIPTASHDAALAAVGADAYLFGGGTDAGATRDIVRISPGGATRIAGRLPAPASDVAAATIGGTAYVVGGYTDTAGLRTILSFSPGHGVRVAGTLPRPLRYAAVAAVGGRLLIAGGTSGTVAQRAILRFDPATGKVTRIGSLPAPLTHAAGAALGDRLLVVGGRGDAATSQRRAILAVDPGSGRVRTVGQLPSPRSDTGAATVAGRVLVLGGRTARGGVLDTILAIAPSAPAPAQASVAGMPVPGRIPPLLDRHDVYAAGRPGMLSPVARTARALVYVPNSISNTVDVIDQRTFRIVEHFATGAQPQHVTPSWDLRTLWVDNDLGNSLTPIDPQTGRPGPRVPVDDPYNLYFTPDGRFAVVVAEQRQELDFRDPHTMRLRDRLRVHCDGIDHLDYTADGRFALASCEFAGRLVLLDMQHRRVVRYLDLGAEAMPQDVKLAPDGSVFYVADMKRGGVWVIDAGHLRVRRFIPTGKGAHGLYTSRDGTVLYVSNRDAGSISVLSLRTGRPLHRWVLPGGGSPDMGGVSADGKILWLSGRYDAVVYAISTQTGRLLHKVRVGQGPHGLAVWPQPGRYSIGHTGILR